jgi:hypothetical protein
VNLAKVDALSSRNRNAEDAETRLQLFREGALCKQLNQRAIDDSVEVATDGDYKIARLARN